MEQLVPLLLVGTGGAIGSLCRFWLSRIQPIRDIPAGTLIVNVTGSFLIAVLASLNVSADAWNLLSIGVLGGYTTFSTFGFETFRLLEDGDFRTAGANVLLNVAGGLLAAYAGFKVVGLL